MQAKRGEDEEDEESAESSKTLVHVVGDGIIG